MKKIVLICTALFMLMQLQSKSSHIIGGDVRFTQTSGNDYTITLRWFREYCSSTFPNDATLNGAGIYDAVTNNLITTVNLNQISLDTATLGDDCFTPTGICVEVYIYTGTVTLANNPNGYYFTYTDGGRNAIVSNMQNNNMTWFCQIPDPALAGGNSSPQFQPYPSDAYFCVGSFKDLDFSCSDADGDSLVYSLVQPLNGSGATSPMPVTLLQYNPTYSLANILGPGSVMIIDSQTGIVTARPGNTGVYLFRVRCEEYRNGVKIGETNGDFQYEAPNCTFDSPPSFANFSSTAQIDFEGNFCYDIVAIDPNPADSFYISVRSNAYQFGAFVTLPPNNGTPGNYDFTYVDTVSNSTVTQTASVGQIDAITYTGLGTVGARFCWSPTECDILSVDTFNIDLLAYSIGCDDLNDTLKRTVKININEAQRNPYVPNVFSPNNDGKNDLLWLPSFEHDKCYDVIHVEIYNRWGIKVFESDDPLFEWDGKDIDGAKCNPGTYYMILQGFFGGENVTKQFPVTLFR